MRCVPLFFILAAAGCHREAQLELNAHDESEALVLSDGVPHERDPDPIMSLAVDPIDDREPCSSVIVHVGNLTDVAASARVEVRVFSAVDRHSVSFGPVVVKPHETASIPVNISALRISAAPLEWSGELSLAPSLAFGDVAIGGYALRLSFHPATGGVLVYSREQRVADFNDGALTASARADAAAAPAGVEYSGNVFIQKLSDGDARPIPEDEGPGEEDSHD